MKKQYIVKSKINPNLIRCSNGEYMSPMHIGAGTKIKAKIFSNIKSAEVFAIKFNGFVVEEVLA
jgi:hypothetical protein